MLWDAFEPTQASRHDVHDEAASVQCADTYAALFKDLLRNHLCLLILATYKCGRRLATADITLISMISQITVFLLGFAQVSFAASRNGSQVPTIVLDNGTFVGSSEGDVSVFRGIPYAKPPCVRFCESIAVLADICV